MEVLALVSYLIKIKLIIIIIKLYFITIKLIDNKILANPGNPAILDVNNNNNANKKHKAKSAENEEINKQKEEAEKKRKEEEEQEKKKRYNYYNWTPTPRRTLNRQTEEEIKIDNSKFIRTGIHGERFVTNATLGKYFFNFNHFYFIYLISIILLVYSFKCCALQF